MEQLVAAIQKAEADAATLAKEIAQLDEDISVYEGDKKAATEVTACVFGLMSDALSPKRRSSLQTVSRRVFRGRLSFFASQSCTLRFITRARIRSTRCKVHRAQLHQTYSSVQAEHIRTQHVLRSITARDQGVRETRGSVSRCARWRTRTT